MGDVEDCCCFAYDLVQDKVFCTPRGRRALEFACDMVDGRFDSNSYTMRLEKYAKRGFSIALPGCRSELVTPSVLRRSYVFAADYNMLFQVDSVGKPEEGKAKIRFADRTAALSYNLKHDATLVTGV